MKKDATIEDLLQKINLKPDNVITMTQNKPIPTDEKLKNKQEITIQEINSTG